jgi:hypothetical protein
MYCVVETRHWSCHKPVTKYVSTAMCNSHYHQQWSGKRLAPTPDSPEYRRWFFFERVAAGPGGCWTWTGSTSGNGYGRISLGRDRLTTGAHQWAWTEFRCPIPDGMTVEHDCHTQDLSCIGGDSCLHRRCVNPDHLRLVTREENSRIQGDRNRRLKSCSSF